MGINSHINNADDATSSVESTPTAYTAHSSGGVTVTSNGATDLDSTAAALDTLRDEVATLVIKFNLLIADVAEIRTKFND